MEKYRLVGEKKSENIAVGGEGSSNDICEVKITQQGKPKNYISYAMNLFVSSLCSVLEIRDNNESFCYNLIDVFNQYATFRLKVTIK